MNDPVRETAVWRPAVAETHTATLFMVGDRVYKRKKPVAFPFLDFRTRQARDAACHREVDLNRRLAPDVYLGVADVSMGGRVCDHLVVMRRMPEDRRLATMVAAGADVLPELRRLARLLAGFHASMPDSGPLADVASRDAVRGRWQQTVDEMRPFGGTGCVLDDDIIARIGFLADRYVEGRKALFDRRIATGKVRDGHGDLLAEDIFVLDDGPRVLDCLEFDEQLRHGDVLADVAFLAMDLERLGAPELAGQFLDWYREFSAETWPASLAHHYIAYRAAVRAKVACLRHRQDDPDGTSEDQARLLSGISLDHLEQGRVRLVLVGGLPGTGKSTLASGLSAELDATHLSSDEIRKELAGVRSDQPAAAAWTEGIYQPAMTHRTYEALLERASEALSLGASVVLDVSWSKGSWRSRAETLAADRSADLTELRCVAPAEVAAARMAERHRRAGSVSDATPAVAAAMAATTDPWPHAISIDTVGGIASALTAAASALASPDSRLGRKPLPGAAAMRAQ